ncbi:Zinc finger and BTB domain-containing protein 1 [Aix galericulata]|nr:Zinc finger and BTB domain-containing protein 1 [Aix galericulata]
MVLVPNLHAVSLSLLLALALLNQNQVSPFWLPVTVGSGPAGPGQPRASQNPLQFYSSCFARGLADKVEKIPELPQRANGNSKMIFGVRMYEDTLTRNGSEANRWGMEPPSSTVNTSHNKEPDEEALQLGSFPEQLFDVCKKSTTSKFSHTKERVSHSRRFGRSFTCDSCGFSFSCEKLLDEHVLTCTNRHSYQSARYYGAEKLDFSEKDSTSKIISTQTEKYKGDSSQAADDSSSPVSNVTSRKSSTVASETSGEEGSRASERKRIIIKMEPEDSPADELKDFNIIKVTDKDCNESSDNDDLDDEQEEPLYRYYVEEEIREKRNARKSLKPRLSMDDDERKCLQSPRHLNRKAPSVQEDVENAPSLASLRVNSPPPQPLLNVGVTAF